MLTRILIRYYRGSAALVNRISPDIKDAAFCTGIKVNNNTDTWRGMLNVYMTTKSASEKNSAQTALTCSQDTLVLYKYVYNCRNSRYFQLARVLGVGDGLFSIRVLFQVLGLTIRQHGRRSGTLARLQRHMRRDVLDAARDRSVDKFPDE